jgi:hypothetical protein
LTVATVPLLFVSVQLNLMNRLKSNVPHAALVLATPYVAYASPDSGWLGSTVAPIVGVKRAFPAPSTVFLVQLQPAMVLAHDASGHANAHGFGATYVGTDVSVENVHTEAICAAVAPTPPIVEHAVWLHAAKRSVVCLEVELYHVAYACAMGTDHATHGLISLVLAPGT